MSARLALGPFAGGCFSAAILLPYGSSEWRVPMRPVKRLIGMSRFLSDGARMLRLCAAQARLKGHFEMSRSALAWFARMTLLSRLWLFSTRFT